MRTSRHVLATALLLGPISLAAARLVAMRVEVQGLRAAGPHTVVALTVQIAPEDRERVGRDAWLRAALQLGDEAVSRIDRAVEMDPAGNVRLEVEWPPGTYRLRVDVESARGDASGFWADAVTVPRLEPVGEPAMQLAPPALPPPPVRAPSAPAPPPAPSRAGEEPARSASGPVPAVAPSDEGSAVLTVIATSGNRPLLDLDRHDLSLRVNGERIPIEDLAGSREAPLSVVLAVALSSTTGEPLARVRQQLGRLALRLADRGASLHLVAREGAARSVAGWDAGPDRIAAVLAATDATGDGDLAATLVTALALLDARPGRRLVVLVTDGGDTAAATAWEAAADAVAAGGAPVLAVGLDGERLASRTRRSVQTLAAASGGTCWLLRDSETLKLVVDHFADLAEASYAVRFRLPSGPGNRPLKIQVDPLAREVEILHPESLAWKGES